MLNIPARRKNRTCREAHTEGGRTVKGWYKALEDLVWLTQLGLNMLLPLVMVCLFSLLLGLNRGERRSCRKLSSLIYVLHPWCIVLVRGGAEVLGLEGPLVENSMGHFLAVLASSAAASWALWLAWSRRPLKRSNKG